MGGETVLVVEDHRENIVHLVNNVLKPGGYNVITAMDGRLGLKRILNDSLQGKADQAKEALRAHLTGYWQKPISET